MNQPFDNIMAICRKHMRSRSKASTVKEALVELKEECGPEVVTEVVGQFLKGLSGNEYSAREMERASMITERKAGWDWDPEPIIAPGVPGDALGFDKFTVDRKHPTIKDALELAQAWVTGVGPGLLVLSGAPGVGKTHLAQAAAAKLQELGRPVVYRQESRLIGELQGLMRGGGASVEDSLMEYGQIKWLVIDELGVTHTRDWGASVMDRIINERWENTDCRTLLTTNLLSEDMPVRMRSRLGDKERGIALVIKAPDYRQRRGVSNA
jgi:DNA replication protein DnaC